MDQFVDFDHIDTTPELTNMFLSQATGHRLNEIIRSSKGHLYCSFHKAVSIDNLYLVMVVGSNDNILIQLAKSCGFPRGFPIIWQPNVYMHYYGFYPKFNNDERQSTDAVKEFDSVVSINFFKKWSGYLGQCMVFTVADKAYWTVSSKNSADKDSKYVQDAKRLFAPHMTATVIDLMARQSIHLCAELMSKNDQYHGTRVLKEAAIVTCVAKGSIYHFDKREDSIRPNFVHFFDHVSLVDFCVANGFSCDSATLIRDRGLAREFMTKLSLERDFMDDVALESLLKSYGDKVDIKRGTATHIDILGDCLEGLVLKLTHEDGSTTTKKYKFPRYTIRTMLFREEFKKFAFNQSLKERARDFCDRWCVTSQGKYYWYNFALSVFINYLTFRRVEENVGDHIQIVEQLSHFVPSDRMSNRFDETIEKLTQGTLVICLGPIGSGKSTMMKTLCRLDERFEEIDGDDLGIGADKTAKSKQERNDFSRFKVIESFMKGRTPVLSTGGGITFSQGKEPHFILRNQIYHALGIIVKLVVFVPGYTWPGTGYSATLQQEKSYDPMPVYNDSDLVKNAVKLRVKSGKWKVDPKFKTGKTSESQAIENFSKFIFSKSKANCEFAKKIMAEADDVYVYPVITSDNYGIQDTLDYSNFMKSVVYCGATPKGKFTQVRLLTFIDDQDVGHITIHYGAQRDIELSWSEFEEIKSFYGAEPIDGDVITMKSGNGDKIIFSMLSKSYHSDGSTHITIDSGIHAGKEMKIAALAVIRGTSVELHDKNGLMRSYLLESRTPCKITVAAVFGI